MWAAPSDLQATDRARIVPTIPLHFHHSWRSDVGSYDSREGGGRVAPGAATESNAGDRQGCWKLEQRRSSCRSSCRDGGNAKGLLAAVPHPCVRGISASDLQGWPLSHVLCFAAPARPGAMEEMQKDCWEQSLPCMSEQSLPCRSPARGLNVGRVPIRLSLTKPGYDSKVRCCCRS